MKIGFASNDWSRSMKDPLGNPVMGGSGHIRVGQYIAPLRRMGVDVCLGMLAHNSLTGTFGIHAYGGDNHFDCDVIVLQRYMHMKVLPDMKKAQAAGQVILNDVDDWYWGLSEKNAAYEVSDARKHPDENIQWYKNIIEECDGVIASTPFLFNKLSEWNENIVLHSNYVDIKQFEKVERFKDDSNKLVVGWMGSTSHRSGDLEILRPYSSSISKFARWHHTGDIVAPSVPRFYKEIGVNAGVVTTSPFLPPYRLQDGFKFQVGIVPLTDLPFNHAKSYIKGLEYAAAGVPFVASWSPQYAELVETHGIGILAHDPADYVNMLEEFTDQKYLNDVSKELRQKIKKFDVNVGARELHSSIMKLKKEAWHEKRKTFTAFSSKKR